MLVFTDPDGMRISLLCVFILTSALAEPTCVNVNLTLNPKWGQAGLLSLGKETRWGNYLRQMSLYDQGETRICYAYVAVQLADFWRETMGIKVTKKMMLSTPLYAALLSRIHPMGRKFGRKELSRGYIDDTLRAIRELGMCREDVIQEKINNFAKGKGLDPRIFQEIVELIFEEYPRKDNNILENMSDAEIWNKYIKKNIRYYHGRKISKMGDWERVFKQTFPHIKKGKVTEFFNDLLKECQNPINIYVGSKSIPDPTSVAVDQNNYGELKYLIRSELAKPKAQPIGISYCSKVLLNRQFEGLTYDAETTARVALNSQDCASHASIIIGMKDFQGKCHYLLRNTWGPECYYDWQCLFNSQKEAMGIWVEENALIKNLKQIYWLKNKTLHCIASSNQKIYFFETDKPNPIINSKNHIPLLGGYEAISINVNQSNTVEVGYWKDLDSFFPVTRVPMEKFDQLPFRADLYSRRNKIYFKMACLPKSPDRSLQESELKKIISSRNKIKRR